MVFFNPLECLHIRGVGMGEDGGRGEREGGGGGGGGRGIVYTNFLT